MTVLKKQMISNKRRGTKTNFQICKKKTS